jgi:exonuclease SbcD
MRFTFIHAADLHIDSPFAERRSERPDRFRAFCPCRAPRSRGAESTTISAKAAFLVMSGIFEGDWNTTSLFFARALGRSLVRAAILQVARPLGL